MRYFYLFAPFLIFSLVPSTFVSLLKPLDLYLLIMLTVIVKALWDHRETFLSKFRSFQIPLAIIVATLFFTTALSDNITISLIYTIRYSIYLLFPLAYASLLRNEEEIEKLLLWFLTIANITGIYAIYQYFHPPQMIPGLKAVIQYSKARAFSTFVNPNFYAEYLALVIPLAFVFLVLKTHPLKRLYGLLTALLLSTALIFTYTRGSFIALVAASAFFFLFEYPLLIAPALLFFILLLMFFPGFAARLKEVLDLNQGTAGFRLKIWRAAFASINNSKELIFGSGPYTFLDELSETVLRYPEYYFGYFRYTAHNNYLVTLIDGGIVLSLAWIYYYAALFYRGLVNRLAGLSRFAQLTSLSIMAAVVALLVNGLTSSTYYHPQIMTVFFNLVGILLAVGAERNEGSIDGLS